MKQIGNTQKQSSAEQEHQFFENPNVQREQGDCARQDRRHCGEEKVGKVGHEGTTTDRTDFEPCRDHSEKRFGSNFQFSCHRQRRLVYCAKELTRHMATPTTADWEQVVRLGRYLKKQTQGSLVVQVSRDAMPT